MTKAQAEKSYEVDDFYEYLYHVYMCGNFTEFKTLLLELNKSARLGFIHYLIDSGDMETTEIGLMSIETCIMT